MNPISFCTFGHRSFPVNSMQILQLDASEDHTKAYLLKVYTATSSQIATHVHQYFIHKTSQFLSKN